MDAAGISVERSDTRLSALDAGFLYLERKELPLAIGNVAVFDGAIPFRKFVRSIEARLALLPRYRKTIERPPLDLARPVWRDDPNFDIRRHIFHPRLESPGTEERLRELAGRIFSERMDRGKPLWELYVVDGLVGGRSALITKVHHAMADGVAGVALMEAMLDSSPRGRTLARPKPYRPQSARGDIRRWLDPVPGALAQIGQGIWNTQKALVHLGVEMATERRVWEGIAQLARLLPEIALPAERLPFNRPCGPERHVAWAEFPLSEVRAVGAAFGSTLNDVVLAVLMGALRRYLRLHGESVAQRFCHVMVPVNVRAAKSGEDSGNRVSLLPLVLPLGPRDPVERLRAVTRRTQAMKKAPVAEIVALLSTVLDAAPAALQALASALPFFSMPFPPYNFLCTNVPGPPAPRYVCGVRMLSSYPHVPTGYEAGVSLAVESYNETLYFGLTIDPRAAPDGERMKELLETSFTELARKAPGPVKSWKARNRNAA